MIVNGCPFLYCNKSWAGYYTIRLYMLQGVYQNKSEGSVLKTCCPRPAIADENAISDLAGVGMKGSLNSGVVADPVNPSPKGSIVGLCGVNGNTGDTGDNDGERVEDVDETDEEKEEW